MIKKNLLIYKDIIALLVYNNLLLQLNKKFKSLAHKHNNRLYKINKLQKNNNNKQNQKIKKKIKKILKKKLKKMKNNNHNKLNKKETPKLAEGEVAPATNEDFG